MDDVITKADAVDLAQRAIADIRADGVTTLMGIAQALKVRGVPADVRKMGESRTAWTAVQVARVLARIQRRRPGERASASRLRFPC
jgi:hypothetical protein